MPIKAVQYSPEYCAEAKEDLKQNGYKPFGRFDSSHDLSIIDSEGKRRKIGTFKHGHWAEEIGKLIEQHGLSGIK